MWDTDGEESIGDHETMNQKSVRNNEAQVRRMSMRLLDEILSCDDVYRMRTSDRILVDKSVLYLRVVQLVHSRRNVGTIVRLAERILKAIEFQDDALTPSRRFALRVGVIRNIFSDIEKLPFHTFRKIVVMAKSQLDETHE